MRIKTNENQITRPHAPKENEQPTAQSPQFEQLSPQIRSNSSLIVQFFPPPGPRGWWGVMLCLSPVYTEVPSQAHDAHIEKLPA